jgi:hypothetical protein
LSITNDVLRAAVSNGDTEDEIMQTIFKQGKDIDISEDIVKPRCRIGDRAIRYLIESLFEEFGADIPITGDIVKAAASKSCRRSWTTNTVLEKSGPTNE